MTKMSVMASNYKIPIICVGNIYVGGTGKTPLASEVFKLIKSINKLRFEVHQKMVKLPHFLVHILKNGKI